MHFIRIWSHNQGLSVSKYGAFKQTNKQTPSEFYTYGLEDFND